MRIRNVVTRRVYADGRHNAFTGLTKWKGEYFLVFRNGAYHTSADGRQFVLRSPDLKTWETAAVLSAQGLDARDAHLFPLDDKLIVMGYLSDKRNGKVFDHQEVRAVSLNGREWSDFEPSFPKQGHLWEPVRHGDKYYAGFFYNYEDHGKWRAGLACSENGLEWEEVSTICNRDAPDETAVTFLPDDTCMALVRREKKNALIATAAPPYTAWTISDSGHNFGGPALAPINKHVLLGARWVTDFPSCGVTALFELTQERARDVFILPSMQDTGYPSFVALERNRLAVSYYSSHEGTMDSKGPSNIYLAEFEVDFQRAPEKGDAA